MPKSAILTIHGDVDTTSMFYVCKLLDFQYYEKITHTWLQVPMGKVKFMHESYSFKDLSHNNARRILGEWSFEIYEAI